MGIALASPTQVSYNIFAAYSLLDTQRKFGLDLNAGLIHGVFDIIGPHCFPKIPITIITFCQSRLGAAASCKLGQKLRMGLRLGSEIMIGYEQDEGTWKIHPRLEPNAALTLLF
jgi:hypothetical protein